MADINQSLDFLLDIENPIDKTPEQLNEVGKELAEKTENTTKKAKALKQKSKYSIEDADFLRDELKHSIVSIDRMMEIMSVDMKPGAKSRDFECYAALVKSKTEALKELRELNDNEQRLVIKEDELKNSANKMMLPFGGQFNQQNILNVVNGGNLPAPATAALSNPDILRKQLIEARNSTELAEIVDSYEFNERAN